MSLLLFATTIPTSLHKVLNIYFQHQNQIRVAALKQALLVPTEPTLVVYILSLADPLYRDNYLYFYHEVETQFSSKAMLLLLSATAHALT